MVVRPLRRLTNRSVNTVLLAQPRPSGFPFFWHWLPVGNMVIFTIVAISAWAFSGGARCCHAEQTEAPTTVGRLIKDLDANRYETRELAERQLSEAGLAALEAVSQSARSGSLETSTRALNILLAWSEGSDAQLRIAALERIATLSNRPKESEIASIILSEEREQAALQGIEELGGHYGNDMRYRGISSLRIIISKDWAGGPEGLKYLAEVRRATTICLHSAPLDERALEHLDNLTHVLRFEFYGTKISEAAVKEFDAKLNAARLEAQLPKAEVERREDALLGIGGPSRGFQPNIPAKVSNVLPNSAAARAGIQPHDTITQIDGEDVANFQALTERIGKHNAGDTATLTVVRKSKTHSIEVTFDQWGATPPLDQHALRNGPIQVPRKILFERR